MLKLEQWRQHRSCLRASAQVLIDSPLNDLALLSVGGNKRRVIIEILASKPTNGSNSNIRIPWATAIETHITSSSTRTDRRSSSRASSGNHNCCRRRSVSSSDWWGRDRWGRWASAQNLIGTPMNSLTLRSVCGSKARVIIEILARISPESCNNNVQIFWASDRKSVV